MDILPVNYLDYMNYLEPFPEHEYAWDDSDDDEMVSERRQYQMQPRLNMEKWDDHDFVYRFRLSKATVAQVLESLKDDLQCDIRRYLFFYSFQFNLSSQVFYFVFHNRIVLVKFDLLPSYSLHFDILHWVRFNWQ